ncbi:MAG: GNAT family N-acetyltransferase [Pseudomonadota bacterium]|nr:GNAT family N-acetyltransferase [Pseudomonadota bacterium]
MTYSDLPKVTFAYLCDHMHLASELARLHFAEWGELLPNWSEADALAELQTHGSRSAIPTTLLALDSAQLACLEHTATATSALIGSVSLLQNDDDRIRDYTPWLASLVVVPAHRGSGHGIALIQRCVQEARSLGVGRLYLYTAGQQPLYARLGWRFVDSVPLGSARVDVMAIDTGAAAATR